jgi:hypothetical protein
MNLEDIKFADGIFYGEHSKEDLLQSLLTVIEAPHDFQPNMKELICAIIKKQYDISDDQIEGLLISMRLKYLLEDGNEVSWL